MSAWATQSSRWPGYPVGAHQCQFQQQQRQSAGAQLCRQQPAQQEHQQLLYQSCQNYHYLASEQHFHSSRKSTNSQVPIANQTTKQQPFNLNQNNNSSCCGGGGLAAPERLHLQPKNENLVHKHLHVHLNNNKHVLQQKHGGAGDDTKLAKRHNSSSSALSQSFALQQARLQARYAARQQRTKQHEDLCIGQQQQHWQPVGQNAEQPLRQIIEQQQGSEQAPLLVAATNTYYESGEPTNQSFVVSRDEPMLVEENQLAGLGQLPLQVGAAPRARVFSASAIAPGGLQAATPVECKLATPPPARSISFSATSVGTSISDETLEQPYATLSCGCGACYHNQAVTQQVVGDGGCCESSLPSSSQPTATTRFLPPTAAAAAAAWQQVAHQTASGSLSSACSSGGDSPVPAPYVPAVHSPQSPSQPQPGGSPMQFGGNTGGGGALSFGINLEQYISKRNERERSRVRNVNDAFDHLKHSLPLEPDKLSKRVSKVEILRQAISYIRDLEEVLGYRPSHNSAACELPQGQRREQVN